MNESLTYCFGFKKSEIIDITDFENSCKRSGDEIINIFHNHSPDNIKKMEFFTYELALLNKIYHEIYGQGFECEQETFNYKFYKPWIFEDETTTFTREKYVLSSDGCWRMIREKRCIGFKNGIEEKA